MPILGKSRNELDRLCLETVEMQVVRLESGRQMLKVPAPEGLMKAGAGPFHFTPEVFVQLKGGTEFVCPRERFLLREGEVGVLAVGLPHVEAPRPRRGHWMNLVVMFSPMSVSWHMAGLAEPGVVRSAPGRVVQTPEAQRLIGYLTDVVEVWHAKGPARESAVRGLMLAFMARLRMVMEGVAPTGSPRESYKVLQCRHYVQRNLTAPQLNVRFLAGNLQCSSDYLSHLFRRETGMTLISFIQQQRVVQARSLLETSTLNIEEVGRAVGYVDPGYFIRVFKRLIGLTPKGYRNRRRMK